MIRYSPQIHGRWCRKKGHNWRNWKLFVWRGDEYKRRHCQRCGRREDTIPISALITSVLNDRYPKLKAAVTDNDSLWEAMKKTGRVKPLSAGNAISKEAK